jgi:hypothetical protein
LIYVLTFLALLLIPATAYNETELDLFASGVIAATDPDAAYTYNVTSGMIAVIRPATQLEIDDMNYAYRGAKEMSVAADTIARHFPGEFAESHGGLRIGYDPYVAIVIFY